MSVGPLDQIPDEILRVIVMGLCDRPTDIIKLGLTSKKLRQRLVDTFWSHITDVENLADNGCRFFNARQHLQIFVNANNAHAKKVVECIVKMSTKISSITTRNSFDQELTNHLLSCLGKGSQQLNRVVLSSCVSNTKEAVSLLRRSRPHLKSIQIDGSWAQVPPVLSCVGLNQILDLLILSFTGQQLSGRELHKLFNHLCAMRNTRIQKLSLDIADSDMYGSSEFVKKTWSWFGEALEARAVESLTLTGTTFDLLELKGASKKVFRKLTSVRVVNNIWSLNHSLRDWLELFPSLNHLSFKLHANYSDQRLLTVNNHHSSESKLDSSSILSAKSHSIIRSFISPTSDTIVGHLHRLSDDIFVISISPN
uniref:F-box domain-containing protein n=1 Tax=Plectus sambesii TaxID=2011161 RepID=A0A914X8S2_9BILA